MSLTIRLLGSPRIERDGASVAGPRGNKAWAVLAYLLLSRQPPSRRKLADLLFADADDPLGALRWSLAQIRRALRQPGALRGDPVELALEPGIEVDLRRVRSTALPEAHDLDHFTGELLEGMSFGASSAFEAWLTVERCHFAATAQALLLERAQAELGAGHPATAARLATCLLELNPLEELHHEISRAKPGRRRRQRRGSRPGGGLRETLATRSRIGAGLPTPGDRPRRRGRPVQHGWRHGCCARAARRGEGRDRSGGNRRGARIPSLRLCSGREPWRRLLARARAACSWECPRSHDARLWRSGGRAAQGDRGGGQGRGGRDRSN